VKLEGEFTRSYLEQYAALYEEVVRKCREVAKDQDLLKGITAKADDGPAFLKEFLRKHPKPEGPVKGDSKKARQARAVNELRAVLARIAAPWEALRAKANRLEGDALDAELASRVDRSVALFKKHDYGKGIASPRLGGSASIHYDLPQWTYDFCKENLKVFKAQPITDSKGQPIKWRGKALHYCTTLTDGVNIKGAVEELDTREVWSVQYALAGQTVETGSKENPLLRLTGVQLLLGTYHFLEASDRVIVYLPGAAGK
jgi:hypothetical protein